MQFLKAFTITAFLLFPSLTLAQENEQCSHVAEFREGILEEVRQKNPQAISSLPECFKLDRTLILKAALINPAEFENAADTLKEDENFMRRLLKISPKILQYASPEIRTNPEFMESATYLSRDSLQYAGWSLLDNKLFMRKMIRIDSRNYKFASDRLKELPENAQVAFSDNGLLLEFAPNKIKEDKNLVKIAIKSNSSAIEFASTQLKEDKELKKLAAKKTSIKSLQDLQDFLQKNYVTENKKKNLGLILTNQGKFFEKNKIIQRNYVTKWQRYLDFNHINQDGHLAEEVRLIAADSRNYPNSWREDFKKYPDLVKKIEKFFSAHHLDHSTIESLSTVYLWKIKSNPLTLVFNLYLLRDSKDADLGPDFADITSLTAIVQKQGKKWEMTVVEVIFDSEIKVEVAYENGHKQYLLWDLYQNDKKDKNPKIIFKVDDRFGEHFEVFEEQAGGKYQMIHQSGNLLKQDKK